MHATTSDASECVRLDVRPVQPKDRMEALLGAYAALARGATLDITSTTTPNACTTRSASRAPRVLRLPSCAEGSGMWRHRGLEASSRRASNALSRRCGAFARACCGRCRGPGRLDLRAAARFEHPQDVLALDLRERRQGLAPGAGGCEGVELLGEVLTSMRASSASAAPCLMAFCSSRTLPGQRRPRAGAGRPPRGASRRGARRRGSSCASGTMSSRALAQRRHPRASAP